MRTVFSMCTMKTGIITEVLCTVAESCEEAVELFREAEPRVIPYGCFVTTNKEIACVCHVFSVFPTTTNFPLAHEVLGRNVAGTQLVGDAGKPDLCGIDQKLGAGVVVQPVDGPERVRPSSEDRGPDAVPQIPPQETVTPPTS